MSLAGNKALAARFFACFDANDIAGALDTMAEDATWWIAGKPGTHPSVGPRTKEQMARLFRRMTGEMKDGLRMKVKGMVAEGDKVAVEVESRADLKNGRVYDQQYHVLIEIRGGKIAAVHEYLDTQHVLAVWFQT